MKVHLTVRVRRSVDRNWCHGVYRQLPFVTPFTADGTLIEVECPVSRFSKVAGDTIAVITVEPADKISFVYNCMQTRLRGQYNGK